MAQIFISHVQDEIRLASALESFLRNTLPKGTTFFRSSNKLTLVGGEQFEERIRSEIRECTALIMMCSEKSFESHWIHIEGGAGWVLNKPVIPICYGGKTKSGLPRPYASFQAVDLDNPHDLLIALHEYLLIGAVTPPPVPSRRLMTRIPDRFEHLFKPYIDLYKVLDEMYPLQGA